MNLIALDSFRLIIWILPRGIGEVAAQTIQDGAETEGLGSTHAGGLYCGLISSLSF